MDLLSPSDFTDRIKQRVKPQWKAVFLAVVIAGFCIHMPALLSDIPNHDGLDSMYFDQNMITSGRWFLIIACGISSFFNIPWLIGILGIFYLACTSVFLVELFEIKDRVLAAVTGMLMVSFPALASTFAYVYTLDGYMLGMMLSVLSVLLVKKCRKGYLFGGISLAFSMGTYQAYLPFAVMLSAYMVLRALAADGGKDSAGNKKSRGGIKDALPYLYMGGIGVVLYYVMLHLLLAVEGKTLDTYQGINGIDSLTVRSIPGTIAGIYRDFLAFTVKSQILFNNVFSGIAILLIVLISLYIGVRQMITKKLWKKRAFFIIMVLVFVLMPIMMDLILIISPEVNYHLLMRYHWVLLPVIAAAFVDRCGKNRAIWVVAVSAFILVFCYAVTDNIAYSNLQKKYEKTYAYCVRLLDRIEQTEGYYQGIPVALVGQVGDVQYPITDITGEVTGSMIGMSGDYLLYTSPNYEKFMKYYLGATLNFVSVEKMGEIYYTDEYVRMESFPGETSVKIIDGVLCVKTENTNRE